MVNAHNILLMGTPGNQIQLFLILSIFTRRKYWVREHFRTEVFDGFTRSIGQRF